MFHVDLGVEQWLGVNMILILVVGIRAEECTWTVLGGKRVYGGLGWFERGLLCAYLRSALRSH